MTMPDQIASWMMFAGSVLVQTIAAAYVYGKLATRVHANTEAIKIEKEDREADVSDLKDEQVRQWESIGRHGERIATIEGTKGAARRI